MRRRTLLTTIGIGSIGVAGFWGTTAGNRESAVDNNGDGGRSEVSDLGAESANEYLQVSIEGYVPDDVHPVDAEESTLLENKHIAHVLEKASEEYENGMETYLDNSDSRILASIRADELAGVEEKIESGSMYVKHNNVTYLLLHYKMGITLEGEQSGHEDCC